MLNNLSTEAVICSISAKILRNSAPLLEAALMARIGWDLCKREGGFDYVVRDGSEQFLHLVEELSTSWGKDELFLCGAVLAP